MASPIPACSPIPTASTSGRTSNLVVTSDYADPLSLATSASVDGGTEDMGTTVRFWKLSDLEGRARRRSHSCPSGKGRESLSTNNAPEGVMSVAFTHRRLHKGVFAATMGGGTIWYAPDATVPKPEFRLVYRVGPVPPPPCSPSPRTIATCCSRSRAPGRPAMRSTIATTGRAFPPGHGPGHSEACWRRATTSSARRHRSRPTRKGIIQLIPARNNGAADCPEVTGEINLDSQANFATHGGPHFLAFNHETRRVAIANYFVQLTPFNLPGTQMAGDDRVCMARLTTTGKLRLEPPSRTS